MDYFAHSGRSDDRGHWQLLRDHLYETAELAASFAVRFGLEKAAFTAGLFHDLGKYTDAFQKRLAGAEIWIDHSTAGAVVLCDRTSGMDADVAQLIAYAILGHHAGLPDKQNEFGHCVERRLKEFQGRPDPAWENEIQAELTSLMPPELLRKLSARTSREHASFDLSVVTRFLFSCLVDADFRNTEAYYAKLDGLQPDREWPLLQDLLPNFTEQFDAHMARLASDSDVGRLRNEILAHVRSGATRTPGFFTLNVPTGGGKTLASLGFALDHARLHGHSRIIYAIPFTSVIDQTAAIFREVLGENHVLEHHSAIEDDAAARRAPDALTGRAKLRLAMEDWAAPVVVTTNVQLFESLFAARTSRARKLHNIAGSIIILDEAQTIPRHLLRPCVRMLDSLAHLFGCTIVLCTATQPALDESKFKGGLPLEGRELAPDPVRLAAQLKRARIERVGPMDNAALVEALGGAPQALVIVNSRKHALELYREFEAAGLDGVVHLTTRQCATHRREILGDVRSRLKSGQACRVVATSLIEAGVDIDFPAVWRAEAGLDSIVQAAGRCNREGRRSWQESVVRVFSTPDYRPPPEIAGLVGAMGRMQGKHKDLLSPQAVEDYFGEVYWQADEGLDREKILADFKINQRETHFSFRTVAEKFRMIESGMEPVIIPFDDMARKSVDQLGIKEISSGRIARKLQAYVVQVPPKARAKLIQNGHVAFEHASLRGDQFAVLKKESLYDGGIGLLWEAPDNLALEDTFI
jgi:CRISPR-associated endonuclease/helicase Cas3